MTAKPLMHEVIRASAGAGKTYALTTRYLRLLREGHEPPSILATTFTRKAAGEILGRVLTRLARAATDKAEAAALARDIGSDVTCDTCRAMLSRVARGLHRLSISTLDSFFSKLSRSFAYELDIPLDAWLVAQSDPLAVQMRLRAIESMLAAEDMHVLLDLLQRLHHDSAQRGVTQTIDRIVADLEDVYRQARDERLWRQIPVTEEFDRDALERLIAVIGAMSPLLPRTQKGETNKTWANAWSKLMAALQSRDWDGVLGNGLVAACASGVYSKVPLTDTWRETLEPLYDHARAMVLNAHAARTAATFDLMRRFHDQYEQLKRSQRVLHFADLPRRLVDGLLASDALQLEDVYFRLDGRVTHLMLDEFQDTSLEQWQVLMPLAAEITAHGDVEYGSTRSFFCVGDVKQAIYGWRGGVAEIFDHIEQQLHLPDEARRSLNVSWRSSQVVLDVVNRTFESLTGNPALEKVADAADAWAARFEAHRAAKDLPGHVTLETSLPKEAAAHATGDDDEDPDAVAVASPHEQHAAGRIAAIARDAPGMSIGVLVRKNKQATMLLDLLRQRGVAASGESGTPLDDDPAVAVILSALHLADHPADSRCAFHIVNSPMSDVLDLHSIAPSPCAAAASDIRRRLLTEGYAGLVAAWARQLAPSCDARGVTRLTQLVELADAYEPSLTLRTRHFIDYVQAAAVEEPSPARVRVMTVHKAKGLEFDIVVLPALRDAIGHVGNGEVYIDRPTPTQPVAAVYRATNEPTRALHEPMQQAWEQERTRRLEDDLSGLYVAMTRARQALHMIVEPITRTSKGAIGAIGWSSPSYAAILRRALSRLGEGESVDGREMLFEDGNPDWHRRGAAPAAHEAATARPVATVSLPDVPAQARRQWRRRSPSSLEGAGRVQAREVLQLDRAAGRGVGLVLHACFEQVQWLDETVQPSDAELLAAAREAASGIEERELARLIARFRHICRMPEVVAALSRPALDKSEALDGPHNELPFAARVGDALLQGRFDRVVIVRRGGRPTRAEVVDFKSDAVDETALAARVEHYRPQVQAYRAALGTMLALAEDAIEVRLLFTSTGRCVNV